MHTDLEKKMVLPELKTAANQQWTKTAIGWAKIGKLLGKYT